MVAYFSSFPHRYPQSHSNHVILLTSWQDPGVPPRAVGVSFERESDDYVPVQSQGYIQPDGHHSAGVNQVVVQAGIIE